MQLKDFHYLYHKVGGDVIHFELSDEKVKSGDSTVRYYGYLAANGAWIIMEENLTNGTYRYAAGKTLYETHWELREGKEYVLYSALTIGER